MAYISAWATFMNYLNECAGRENGARGKRRKLVIDEFPAHMLRHPYVKYTTKNFVFLYALKSWILYVISMRLSGNTVTRSMSRSMISDVRASAFRTVFAAA